MKTLRERPNLPVRSSQGATSRTEFQAFVAKAVQFIRLGVHLLVVDLFPPSSRDPQGMHAAIWSEMIDYDFVLPEGKRLTVASYSAGTIRRAFVETLAVGNVLPAMPLFLAADRYVEVPLESTYQTAFDNVPKPYRERLSEN